MPTKKTELPAAVWRVLLAGRKPKEIIAVSAIVSAGGVLRFADQNGRLLKAFAPPLWLAVELVDDPCNSAFLSGLASIDDLCQVEDLGATRPTP